MKAKLLSFVFICFSESGLFKGLRAKKIKKFGRRSTRLPGCARRLLRPSFSSRSRPRQPDAALVLSGEMNSTIFCFAQGMASPEIAEPELPIGERRSAGPLRPATDIRRDCLNVAYRRVADVADHGPGRLDWADSAPKGIGSGRTGVQAKPVIPLRARSGLNRRLC